MEVVVRPVDTVEVEVAPVEPSPAAPSADASLAAGCSRGTPLAGSTRQPMRLRDPACGVAPDRGPVLADRESKRAASGEGNVLRVAVRAEGAARARPLEHACGRELPLRVVDPDHACSAPRHPGRDVARAAAELDDVAADSAASTWRDLVFRCTSHVTRVASPTRAGAPRPTRGGLLSPARLLPTWSSTSVDSGERERAGRVVDEQAP